jgi:hypothetical protein
MAVAETMRPALTLSWTWTGPNSVSVEVPLTTTACAAALEPVVEPGVVDGDTIPAGGAVDAWGPAVPLLVLVG